MGIYDSIGNPSVAKFRCRLEVIKKASRSGRALADHWNPKGRYFKMQREMIAFFNDSEKQCDSFLDFIERGKRH